MQKFYTALGGMVAQFVLVAADAQITLSEWGTIVLAGLTAAGVWKATNR